MRGFTLGMGMVLSALFAGAAHAQFLPANNGAVATNLSVSTLTTGMVLDATSAISADGRYITLKVKPSFSQLNGIDTFQVGPQTVNIPQTAGTVAAGGAVGAARLAANRSPAQATPLTVLAAPRRSIVDDIGPGANNGPLPMLSDLSKSSQATPSEQPSVSKDGVPFRPAQVGTVLYVEPDKTLLTVMASALRADDMTLRQAITKLAKDTNTNIVLGSAALRQAKIDDHKPLKLDLPIGTLKETLTKLLPVAAPEQQWVVQAEDKVIFITTGAQADNMVVTKTYHEIDLIKNSPRWLSTRVDLGAGKEKDPNASSKTPSSTSSNIMLLITQTIRPDIWKMNGGKIGEIYEVGDKVTITAPITVHAILEGPTHVNPNAAPTYFIYSSQ